MSTVTKPGEVEELEKLAELRSEGALTDAEFAKAKAEVLEHMTVEPAPAAAPAEDVIGAGRYILSFVLAGLLGLAVAYFLRRKGWLPIWINAAIFVVAVLILVSV